MTNSKLRAWSGLSGEEAIEVWNRIGRPQPHYHMTTWEQPGGTYTIPLHLRRLVPGSGWWAREQAEAGEWVRHDHWPSGGKVRCSDSGFVWIMPKESPLEVIHWDLVLRYHDAPNGWRVIEDADHIVDVNKKVDSAIVEHAKVLRWPAFESYARDVFHELTDEEFDQRLARGVAKYGCTPDNADLTREQWDQHFREEILDAVIYLCATDAEMEPDHIPDAGEKVEEEEAVNLSALEDTVAQWVEDSEEYGAKLSMTQNMVMDLLELATTQKAEIESLQKDKARLDSVLRMDRPWPLHNVLAKLEEAANILLVERCYDGDGWELIKYAAETSKEIRAAVDAGMELEQ